MELMLLSIDYNGNIVMLNVETDATVGPILKSMQIVPGLFILLLQETNLDNKKLYDLQMHGFDIVAVGKVKITL